jgi:hypothetical protein
VTAPSAPAATPATAVPGTASSPTRRTPVFGALLASEIRRALSRRVTWMLVIAALGGIVILGLVAFVQGDETDLSRLTQLWPGGREDGILLVTGIYLIGGALVGAASVVGAEWKAGTVSTWLTWEPRRVRAIGARFGAVAVCAMLIGAVLQALLVAALLPTVLTSGSTSGADSAWLVDAVAGAARGIALVGMAAVTGAAIATLGRSTSAAIGAGFVYLAIIEGLVRGIRPSWAGWLVGENAGTFFTGQDLVREHTSRSVAAATVTILVYVGLLVTVAVLAFQRRDVTGAQ